MRIIFFSDKLTIVLCVIIWPIIQVTAALICLYLPDRFFLPDSFLFCTRNFEKEGRIYDSFFKVSRWKHLLPDGGAIFKKRGFRKKKLDSFSSEYLNRFLIESARGELTHWLAILPFLIFGFLALPQVILYMLIYALLVNMPCIIAQRYNRPRVSRLLKRISLQAQSNGMKKA